MDLNFDSEELICSKCGGLMFFKGQGLFQCEDCGHEYLNDYGKVRRFLDKRGRGTVPEISAATGIAINKVLSFLKEGRIMLTSDSVLKLHCDCCGTVIRYGTLCDRCSHKIRIGEISMKEPTGSPLDTATGTYKVLSTEPGSGMRFINNQSERIRKQNKQKEDNQK
ncbi:MAG: hypothetical protein J6P16_03850 [Eubacterium sp.]|nr:hypothetical protein [Eubacterium sp.]